MTASPRTHAMPCTHCDDTGWRPVEVDGVRRMVRCDCWRLALAGRLLAEARIPRRYAHCELANFELNTGSVREAHRLAAALVDRLPAGADKGLLLMGRPGVGKTHLAVATLKAAIRARSVRGLFFEVRDLLKLVRHTYSAQAELREMDVLGPVLESELLVLDDLGAEKSSEWVEETLGLVINTRYSENRITILTTNFEDLPDSTDPNALIYRVGARVRSRLHEMCTWVTLQAPDFREVGPHPTAEEILDAERRAPATPGRGLPGRTKGPARARLRDRDAPDLFWSGGKAGR